MNSETITKRDVVEMLLRDHKGRMRAKGCGRAPVNIALCKYWGKRDENINLPLTPSLSISLNGFGAQTEIEPIDSNQDQFVLNGEIIDNQSEAKSRVVEYLDLFREDSACYKIESNTNIPVAAGLASSASGFAALALAADDLFGWKLDRRGLSILARLGSGSACRSLYSGFSQWLAGERADGMDSYAVPIESSWNSFRIGMVEISNAAKPIGSRAAMSRTVATSELYKCWPDRVSADMAEIRAGIKATDLERAGTSAEGNALAMHATMLDSHPSILYWKPESVAAMERVWSLRNEGVSVYFTMDAGPNIKLIFEDRDTDRIESEFIGIQIDTPLDSDRSSFNLNQAAEIDM